MRIAIMGAGGVGGYVGGALAKAGNDVSFVARGSHLEAMRQKGLQMKTANGDYTIAVPATNDPAQVGIVDLVVLTVKSNQNAQAIPALLPMVGENTSILSLQNGVDSYEELAKVVGPERALPGTIYIESHIESPGVVRQSGDVARIVFGEMGGELSARAQLILEAFLDANLDAHLSQDIAKTLWSKLLYASSSAGTAAAARVPMSRFVQHAEARDTILAALTEVEAVGRAKGIEFDDDVVEVAMTQILNAPKDVRSSIQIDLSLGVPIDIDTMNGAVVRIGKELGVPTPVHSLIYSILLPHKDGY